MRSKSSTTKKKLKMGTGEGANYKPYIQVGEFGSLGTATCVVDYKSKRTVHLLSQAEVMAWYLLRWDDNNLDIKEQFPLPLEETIKIAEELGLKHPMRKGQYIVMTSDFYVHNRYSDFVISVKANLEQKMVKNLFIEKMYWASKGIKWKLVLKDDMDRMKYSNIRDVVLHYNDTYFADEKSFVKFLIARKYLKVDLSNELDLDVVISERKDEIEKWKTLQLEQEK